MNHKKTFSLAANLKKAIITAHYSNYKGEMRDQGS